jgi:hypothetical protein
MADADFQEPFLAPDARFDTIHPSGSLQNWLLAACLEAYSIRYMHSSYFADVRMVETLQSVCDLGYSSAELQRRLRLLQQRDHS